jgi:NAD(P)-dependent dehydrogenase (short-subunit alcohol dehydrogenase family)
MPKIALVTGASRGIGAATARLFAQRGYSVVLAARGADALASLAADIEAHGGHALAVPTDVADQSSVERLVQRAVAEYGGLDVAFNNAGSGAMPAPLADLDPNAFDAALRVNIFGTYLCMRSEIAAMRNREHCAIVNMSSTAGLQGVAGLSAYCAGKHAVIGLTKAAALDYAAAGIRINAIAPGPIGTEHINAEQSKRIGALVPLKRVGRPEEVAELVVWLCSEESAFITGTILPIDGGRLSGTPAFAVSS